MSQITCTLYPSPRDQFSRCLKLPTFSTLALGPVFQVSQITYTTDPSPVASIKQRPLFLKRNTTLKKLEDFTRYLRTGGGLATASRFTTKGFLYCKILAKTLLSRFTFTFPPSPGTIFFRGLTLPTLSTLALGTSFPSVSNYLHSLP